MEKRNRNSDGVLFTGGAQKQLRTFKELASDTLDTSWPNWRNYENPEIYIIPPIFSYSNPDKSDQDVRDHDNKNHVVRRRSEWAEHLVYKAISAADKKELAAPILAVYSLDLNRIKQHLPDIFPNVQVSQDDPFLREYDFVLIGPKIGLVVIEVKSSEFNGPSDFKCGKRLPKDYIKGIKQLQDFSENFLNFLQECTGVEWPKDLQVRRVLFMPNLERGRHEKWRESLDKRYLKTTIGSFDDSDAQTIKWYKDDLDNGNLTTISMLFGVKPKQQISRKLYETYASIIASLASVIVFKKQATWKLDPLELTEKEAILKEADRIEAQNPAARLLKKRNVKVETLKHFSEVILLTRQQLVALNGPDRQFIIGPAGTGKTIILQEKALRLMQTGSTSKVLILAPDSYLNKYEKLLELNSRNGYEVRSWTTLRHNFPTNYSEHLLNILQSSYETLSDPIEALYQHLGNGKSGNSEQWRNLDTRLEWMAHFDAILIDDAFDMIRDIDKMKNRLSSVAFILTIMIYSELKFPSQTLWISLDPLTPQSDPVSIGRQVHMWVLQMLKKTDNYDWSCTVLDRVMRSTENIFHASYSFTMKEITDLLFRPSLGHKVIGPEVTEFRDMCHITNAAKVLWMRTKGELERLLSQGMLLTCISIVVGGYDWDVPKIMKYFIIKLQEMGIPLTVPVSDKLNDVRQKTMEGSTKYGIGEALAISFWDDISSLEWPIVIYVETRDIITEKVDPFYVHQRYRALSRATTKLIKILAVCFPIPINSCHRSEVDIYSRSRNNLPYSYIGTVETTTKEERQLRNMAATAETLAMNSQRNLPLQICYKISGEPYRLRSNTIHVFDLESKIDHTKEQRLKTLRGDCTQLRSD